jgi:hypothetical protein
VARELQLVIRFLLRVSREALLDVWADVLEAVDLTKDVFPVGGAHGARAQPIGVRYQM